MNVVKELMVVLRIAQTLEDHICVVVMQVIVSVVMDTPVTVQIIIVL